MKFAKDILLVFFSENLLMFLSTYSPMFLILSITQFLTWPKTLFTLCVGIIFLVLCVIGIAYFYLAIICYSKKSDSRRMTIKETHNSGRQVVGYLSGYLLPFITMNKIDLKTCFAYLIFFFVAYKVTVHTDVIQINPLFFIAGYRFYATETEYEIGSGKSVIKKIVLISKKPLISGQIVHLCQVFHSKNIRICV